MALDFEIRADNSAEVIRELDSRIEAALEACGNQAVSHAKQNITQAGRVDTGAMRNSLNHTVKMSEKAVYIGTNIEYALYHEYGTGIYLEGGGGRQSPWYYKDEKGNGHWTHGIKPIHFLKNAVEKYKDQYKAILEKHIKG